MKRLLTPEEMARCDRAAMERTPSRTLMERAAHACADAVSAMLSRNGNDRVFVLAGTGNNGGDGIACARFLCEAGIPADICILPEREERTFSAECRYQYKAALAAGVKEVPLSAFEKRKTVYTAAVDALFGIGLSRPVTGEYEAGVRALNDSGLPVLAVDVPSGISALDGSICGCAVRAEKTVTMAYAKPGLYRYPGTLYTGEIEIADIGIDDTPLAAVPPLFCIGDEDFSRRGDGTALLPPRKPDGNKGTNGRVLVAAGSRGMSGAAYFSAKAAYRCGAGLVQLLTPEDNRVILQTQLPEAVMTTYNAENPDTAVWADAVRRADVIVLGPGLGTGETAEKLVRFVLSSSRVPTVIDADALNLIAAREIPLPDTFPVILTPHPGELSRLTGVTVGELLADLPGYAKRYAQSVHAVVAAKDARTVVTDGSYAFLNTSGSSALAKGGSGDVLTGVIAALLAAGCEPLYAAALGVYIHGKAGEYAERQWGARGVLASELPDSAALVLRDLTKE